MDAQNLLKSLIVNFELGTVSSFAVSTFGIVPSSLLPALSILFPL